MAIHGGTAGRWISRALLTALFVGVGVGLAGCEQRVVEL